MITSFKDEYRFLSNFYPCQVVYRCGLSTYPYVTAEHAYQAQKASKPADMKRIAEARTPGDAKRAGRLVQWEPGQQATWEQVKKRVMLEVVLAKFNQNDELRKALILTHPEVLIEGNTRDDFWGCVPSERRSMMLGKPFWGADKAWFGENYLGQILMAVRMVLR